MNCLTRGSVAFGRSVTVAGNSGSRETGP